MMGYDKRQYAPQCPPIRWTIWEESVCKVMPSHSVMQPVDHAAYWPLSVIALLLPPLGILCCLIYACRSNTLDKLLARALLGKTILLPAILLLIYLLIISYAKVTP